jgi:hypothetical protein
MTSLAERWNRWLFGRVVRHVLRTPPTQPGDQPFVALTMVHRRDVLPYLLAIKSFAAFARPQRVVVVADPTLGAAERQLLQAQLPHLEWLQAADFRHPHLPVGGTWERLAAISMLCAELPVVQLDADTLTMGIPTEVLDAVAANRSFVIRSEAGVEIQPLDAAAATGQRLLQTSRHIQAAAEARLTEVPGWQDLRYARGCSGFTGFARGALSLDRLTAVSAAMRVIHGARWDEWGTEQVTSNLMAASDSQAFLLPHPRYCNADSLSPETIVSHFIGYARHVDRRYEQLAHAAIQRLLGVSGDMGPG